MVSFGKTKFRTLQTLIKYGDQRFNAKEASINIIPSQRQRLFPRGQEFNITSPFKAFLSISLNGMKSFEEVISFAASPQIADCLDVLAEGRRQEGHIRIGPKRDYRAFVFSIKKETRESWRVSLFDEKDEKMKTELARMHGSAQDLVRIKKYAEKARKAEKSSF